MKRLPLFRLFVAYGMGILSFAESINPNFLPSIHWFVALFGALWFVQAAFLHRQIRAQRG
jgi:hypothetical protein